MAGWPHKVLDGDLQGAECDLDTGSLIATHKRRRRQGRSGRQEEVTEPRHAKYTGDRRADEQY